MNKLDLRLPVDEFRSLPIPGYAGSFKPPKLATFFIRASAVPAELAEWMKVNPRIPKLNRKEKLTGPVATRIIETLTEEPELFALKNLGIYVLADRFEHRKEQGGHGELLVSLTDPNRHGIVNGGHTFKAIRQVVDDPDGPDPSDAWVRMHVIEGLTEGKLITEIAEGMNRSLQVTDQALANLAGAFEEIKSALKGKRGADQISYTSGESGDVDIQDILSVMALLNLKAYPNEDDHPNDVFGQPRAVLDAFKNDIGDSDSAFRRMYPRLHDILILWDRIQEETAKAENLGLLGRKRGKEVRKKDPKKGIFSGRLIDRPAFAGLIYPIIAAFRANVSKEAWAEGRFEWIVDPEVLLKEAIPAMSKVVKSEYSDNNSKPAEVGKKEAAYRGCYADIMIKLARMGKLT
jgi:hypothetical protein